MLKVPGMSGLLTIPGLPALEAHTLPLDHRGGVPGVRCFVSGIGVQVALVWKLVGEKVGLVWKLVWCGSWFGVEADLVQKLTWYRN